MKVIQAVCALSLCIALLGSCASTPRAPFTEVDEMAAVAPGTHNIRIWLTRRRTHTKAPDTP